MSGFEHFQKEIEDIERAIARLGVVLGIDWQDAAQMRTLAAQALDWHPPASVPSRQQDAELHARIELYGLMQLMLTVMTQSAEEGMLAHGGPIWKTLGHALWREIEMRQTGDAE